MLLLLCIFIDESIALNSLDDAYFFLELFV